MSAPSAFSGGCACGAIRYECSSAPVVMLNCHCRDCQRASGTAYAAIVILARGGFRVSRGSPRLYEATAERGSTTQRYFCGDCGSPLFAHSTARPTLVGIRAGSLDDPSWFRATMDLWTESAQPWDPISADTIKLAKEPPPRT